MRRNDALDVAEALDKLGFTVITGFDLKHIELGRIIRRFAASLTNAQVGVSTTQGTAFTSTLLSRGTAPVDPPFSSRALPSRTSPRDP
jgi:uncharacterized caspase-like protein